MSNTNQVYDIVDFDALHESLHEDLMEMAKWKELQMIDRACEWLMNNVNNYIINDKSSGKDWLKVKSEMFDDFKKAMEE